MAPRSRPSRRSPRPRPRPAPVVREPDLWQEHCAVTLAWIEAVARDVCSKTNPVVKRHGIRHAYFMAGKWGQSQVEDLKERLSMELSRAIRPDKAKLDAWEEENITTDVEVELDADYDVKYELWRADRRYIKLEVRGIPE